MTALTEKERPKVEARFWAKVDRSGECWLWTSSQFLDGYGCFWLRGGNVRAHRVAWLLQGGEPSDLSVLHRCDTPLCQRKDHLFLGTNGDNCRDMGRKGRACRGSKKWSARLDEQKIPVIRQLRAEGHTYPEIAARVGAHPATVRDVVVGNTWRHV